MNKLRIFAVALTVMALASVAQAASITISDAEGTSPLLTLPGGGTVSGTYSDTSWTVSFSGKTKPAAGYGSATSPDMDLMIIATRNGVGSANSITITFSDSSYGPFNGTMTA